MKLKLLLPWLCVLGLLIGLAYLYSSNAKQAVELAKLNQDSLELQQLRAAAEEAKKAPESEELVRLRKENEDVLRLRNEVRQLRGEKQQLSKQATTAEAQAQSAQALVQVQAQRLAAAQTAAASAAEQQAAAARLASAERGTAACINNLRQIDGAKQQWALENKKAAEDVPAATDLAPYLKGNALTPCPAGGVYTINAVGAAPACNIPGHALPK